MGEQARVHTRVTTDLALVYPRFKYPSGDPALGLASIAATVRRAGYRVQIVDATWHPRVDWVVKEVERLDPAYVGIYVSTLMAKDAGEIARRIRSQNPERHIVAGGPHATVLPQSIDWADTVVQGEGEVAMLNIMGGGAPVPSQSPLPPPALDLLDMNRYMAHHHYFLPVGGGWRSTNVMASRGCPFHCTFCSKTLNEIFGPGVRYREAGEVAEEIRELNRDFGVNAIYFQDDTLTASPQWLESFFVEVQRLPFNLIWGCNLRAGVGERLIERMAIHGLRVAHMGVEAASDRIRNGVYRKGTSLEQIWATARALSRWRVATGGFFMLNAPGETLEEMQQTVELALALPLEEASFSICVPLPGTDLYDALKAEGSVLSDDVADYDYYRTSPYRGDVPLEKVQALQREALVRFYARRPGYIARHFTSLSGVKRLVQKVRRVL